MHEASLYTFNSFITLTYDEQNLPEHASLEHRDFQLFMKRLRKKFTPRLQGVKRLRHLTNEQAPTLHDNQTSKSQAFNNSKFEIRYYMGGEYGEERGRPHFHAALFNLDFADKKHYKQTPQGNTLYTSEILSQLWGKGFACTGELTFESAAYIARYIMKKQTGQGSQKHYETIDEKTGEIIIRKREYNRMSTKPGIGYRWLQRYMTDVYPEGRLVVNGHLSPPPRYYDKQFRKLATLEEYKQMKLQRQKEGDSHSKDKTPQRLAVQEKVKQAATRQLKRGLK